MRTALLLLVVATTGLACRQPNAACKLTSECLGNEVCRSGWCRATCNADSECLSGESCRDGACMAVIVETPDAGHDSARVDAVLTDARPSDQVALPDTAVRDARQLDSQLRDQQPHTDSWTRDQTPADLLRDAGPIADSRVPDARRPDANPCALSNIYWNTTDPCPDASNCGIDLDAGRPTCLAAPPDAGGAFYQACGVNQACPFGSRCFDLESDRCLPYCLLANGACPDYASARAGLCIYGLFSMFEEIGLCERAWNCDPIANTGCPLNWNCFRIGGWGNICLESYAGEVPPGQPCQADPECQIGLVCSPYSGTCKHLCTMSPPAGCDGGTVCQLNEGNYGMCEHGVDSGLPDVQCVDNW